MANVENIHSTLRFFDPEDDSVDVRLAPVQDLPQFLSFRGRRASMLHLFERQGRFSEPSVPPARRRRSRRLLLFEQFG